MPNKKSTRKINSYESPTWRKFLLSVPEAERCRSQKDLARSLELIDGQIPRFIELLQIAVSKSDDTPALKATLASFDIEFSRFHLNTAIPLYPAEYYPDIILWLVENQDSDWMFLRMLQENLIDKTVGREGMEKVLGAALNILYLHYLCCSTADSSSDYNFDEFATFWTGFHRRWDELEEAGANEVLAGLGSRLTIWDLRMISNGVRACFLAFDARKKGEPEAASLAWISLTEWASKVLEGNTLKPGCTFWWYFTDKVMDVLETEIGAVTFDNRWRIPANSELRLRLMGIARLAIDTIRLKLAPKILKAVEDEEPRDDALRAYALFKLADAKSMGLEPWRYDEVEELLQKGDEALKGCKDWLPPLFRKLLKYQFAETVEVRLTHVRRENPRDFRSITLGRGPCRNSREEVNRAISAGFSAATKMYTCGLCEAQGRDMAACAGCKKVRYCSKACQKAAWKGGHKEECSKLAAAKSAAE